MRVFSDSLKRSPICVVSFLILEIYSSQREQIILCLMRALLAVFKNKLSDSSAIVLGLMILCIFPLEITTSDDYTHF